MKKIFSLLFSAILLITAVCSSVSAEDASGSDADLSKLIISEPVAMNFSTMNTWYSSTQESVNQVCLRKLGYTESGFRTEKLSYGLVFASCNDTARDSITIYQMTDSWSEKVFDLSTAAFAEKTELPQKVLSLPQFSEEKGITGANVSEADILTYNNADYAVFDMWFTKNTTQHTAQVHATVINGFYVIIIYDNIPTSVEVIKSLPESTKQTMKSFMKSVSFLDVQEKAILSREQIFILIGSGACLLFIIILSSMIKARKRKRYL